MCGFVGLIGYEPVAPALSLALQAIQHRGQDAAGLGVYDRGTMSVVKNQGMVPAALPPAAIQGAQGSSGIGHVRYPTHGSTARGDAQPFMTRRPPLVLAHNGNITNVPELRGLLDGRGIHMMSGCDAEPLLLILADELLKQSVRGHTTHQLVTALEVLMRTVRGGYAAVAIAEIDDQETLIAFRDPHGIRPCVYGRRADGAWMAASESVSLDVLEFELQGQVPPGCVLLMRGGAEPVMVEVLPKKPHHCVFEDIYFARPDSVTPFGRVNGRRWKFGRRLADEWKAKGYGADVVVAVPDTSRPAAMAMAERLGARNREGFIKNRYSARTFIMPDQATREAALLVKLNPIDEIFRGQRVVLVDDSIVRGTTMRRIVHLVRRHAPASLHVAIFAPPVRNPCYYGIDMPSREELVAGLLPPDELESRLAEHFGADSVTFLSLEGLRDVAGDRICAACFTGTYPVDVNEEERGYILKERRSA